MTSPHDAPTATELLESVREWLSNDVIAATEGRLRFHARVAVNILATVERELALGADQAVAHARRLATLGVADDAALAAAIRRREFDDRSELLRTLLLESIEDKLLVANPKYLDPPG